MLVPVSELGLRKENREESIIACFLRRSLKSNFFAFTSAAVTFGTETERMQRHVTKATAFMNVFLRISTSLRLHTPYKRMGERKGLKKMEAGLTLFPVSSSKALV